jgi:hypothetical protein
MSEKETPKPEAPKAENPSSDSKALIKDVTDILKAKVPFSKPAETFLFSNGRGLREGAIGFLVIAAILSFFVFIGGYHLGANKLDEVKGELKEAKQDRDKYELELSPFQAMAIKIYTNTPIEQRLPLLIEQMNTTVSNLLSSIETEKPSFELYINNELITNFATVSLKQDRHLNIVIRNISKVTADKASVAIVTPFAIGESNVISDFSWKFSPYFDKQNAYEIGTNALGNNWIWVSDSTMPGNSMKNVNPFEIETNMIYPVIPVKLSVFSISSNVQTYIVTLAF